METLLNAVWLLVSAAIAIAWIRQRRNQHRWLSPGVQVLALACTEVFLFPVISATDDLQATALAVETTDTKQNPKKFAAQRPCWCTTGSSFPPAILQSTAFLVADVGAVILPIESSLAISATSFRGPIETRPPPSSAI
jgi:hypothetical protein